ncbi:MAG TPA: aldo/keto reductase [Alphaproteobacteria bacterium]|nr:aldo/keto reductase [Alphaproteobacteria bacterium]
MDYRRLGDSGVRVSPLCLGTMMFGGQTDAAEAERILESARAAGVNFIDTADVYNAGASETMVGRLIARDRSDWVLATKAVNPMGKGPNRRGAGRKWLVQACEDSVQRLGTDYLDILYLHIDDYDTPLDETLDTLADLIDRGYVHYFGISNFPAWRIADVVHTAAAMGLVKPVVCQPNYSLVNRLPETEILPACAHFGIGVAPYSPLARGILTGKYGAGGAPTPGTRAGRNDVRLMEAEWRPESLAIAEKFVARAQARGFTGSQYAVAWVLNNEAVTSVIAGPRTLEQWEDYLGALDCEWTADDEAFTDPLVAAGHLSTPGFTDPKYPVIGRFPRTG